MDGVNAYGAGLAGKGFDANTFIKKPVVAIRILALVFGAAIWYFVTKGAWHKELVSIHQQCLYNGSSTTCSWASAMGFFSFVAAAVLLFVDANFDKISAIQTRRRVVLADLVVSGVFTILFLLGFLNMWKKYSAMEMYEEFDGTYAKLAIFFCFLSSAAWGGCSFFTWRKYQQGAVDTLAGNYAEEFTGIPGDAADGYGYGGNSEGIGSVDSYQQGAAPMPAVPNTNPFHGQDSYHY